jgi:uncharacterized protein YbjT (DUF2867 family)
MKTFIFAEVKSVYSHNFNLETSNPFMEKILITGATGNVGLSTLRLLLEKNYPGTEVVAAVRDIENAAKIEGIGKCSFVKFEFDEASTYESALKGVTKLVLIKPNQVTDVSKHVFPFLDCAKSLGIKQIVFVSIVGAEKNRFFANHRIEIYLKKLGVPYTILRPTLYMQNLITLHQHDIKDLNRIYIPAGLGLVNYTDVRDVAGMIVEVLTKPGHEMKEYEITGPEAMDFYKIAGMFTKELGREIKYSRPLAIKFIRQKLLDKRQLALIVTLSLLYGAARNGKMGHVSNSIKEVTGREPRNLANFIHEYRNVWIK